MRTGSADARVAAMLARHSTSLMRVARQWSLCHDDALDAFQRGLEIYVRRLDTVEPATEAAWLKVVIRHEAMAIRRARSDCVADEALDLDGALPAAGQRSVEEQVLSGDRVSRSAEALRALKPDEARALMLKAHGMSYDEIGRHCGWTYTKVNRAITEGRRRFMEVYRALEEGEQCERFAPVLQALAAGTATSDQMVEIRPHLRHCTACRATVRELHESKLRRLPLLVPLPALVAPLRWLRDRIGGGPKLDPTALDTHDLPLDGAVTVPHVPGLDNGAGAHLPHASGLDGAHLPHVPGLDGAVELPNVPDVGAPTPTADPSGLDGLRPLPDPGDLAERIDRLARVKHHVLSLTQRVNSSDLAAAVHALSTLGGGRVATLGAIVGLCLSGVGAGTVCIVTGVLHAPFGLGGERHRPVVVHPPRPAKQPALPRHGGRILAAELTAARTTPTPTATPRPHRAPVHRARHRAAATKPAPTAVPASVDPSQGTAPTSQEHAPISPAPAQPATQEFAPAPASGTGTKPAPAPAPATGGTEFGP